MRVEVRVPAAVSESSSPPSRRLPLSFLASLLLALLAGAAHAEGRGPRVAFLVSEGTLVLDLTGAYEVFAQARMRVYTVARTTDPVRLSSNLRVIPNHSLADSPDPDILVIPSGGADTDSATIAWIRAKAAKARYVLTVCGGVYPAYQAGLLDGLTATTYGPLIDHFEEFATRTKVVTDRRFVDNGRIVTAGSYVAGIDAALYIVSRMYGEPRAQEVANNIEYDWDRSYRYVRSRLADTWLAPLLDFGPPLEGRTLTYRGDEERWSAEYEVERKQTLEQFSAQIPEMARMHHWRNLTAETTADRHVSKWTRRDLENREWICTVTIRRIAERQNGFRLSYEIARR